MHIALCHDAVIPPLKYGGTERIVYWLARALIRMGHRVTIVAREGSNVPGAGFVPYQEGTSWDHLIPSQVDIAHLWATPSSPLKRPFVVTVGGNGVPGEKFYPNTLFVSRKHAENHGGIHYVYNGIPFEEFSSNPVREKYLVFLAKASWKVKNLKGAIQLSRAAGMRLEVLGSRDWPGGLHRLLPAWRGVRYRGMVDDIEKRKILCKASALLFPVRWHEPFGVAITEALASGCPVFGTPYGSLPEIVTSETGVLSHSGRELLAGLRNLNRFSPERCRARVNQGFSDHEMAKTYFNFYQTVLDTGKLSALAPTKIETRPGFVAQDLLPWEM